VIRRIRLQPHRSNRMTERSGLPVRVRRSGARPRRSSAVRFQFRYLLAGLNWHRALRIQAIGEILQCQIHVSGSHICFASVSQGREINRASRNPALIGARFRISQCLEALPLAIAARLRSLRMIAYMRGWLARSARRAALFKRRNCPDLQGFRDNTQSHPGRSPQDSRFPSLQQDSKRH